MDAIQYIADKTKRYRRSGIGRFFSVLAELLSYLIFLVMLTAAFSLPGYLEKKLDIVEDEIGFYTLDPDEREIWKLIVQASLVVLSILPLFTAIVVRVARRRGKVLNEIYRITQEK